MEHLKNLEHVLADVERTRGNMSGKNLTAARTG